MTDTEIAEIINEAILSGEDIKQALEALGKPQPYIYSSGCFDCGKSFVSYERMPNFMKCEEHKTNDKYLIIKPLND